MVETLNIGYHEFKSNIEFNGKKYSAFGALSIDFEIHSDYDDSGPLYTPKNVDFYVYDVTLVSSDLDEIDESSMEPYFHENLIKTLEKEIDIRVFNERMVEKYLS